MLTTSEYSLHCNTTVQVVLTTRVTMQAGTLDFAGGDVVHISSGVAGLVASIMVGRREGFGSQVPS